MALGPSAGAERGLGAEVCRRLREVARVASSPWSCPRRDPPASRGPANSAVGTLCRELEVGTWRAAASPSTAGLADSGSGRGRCTWPWPRRPRGDPENH